MQRIDYHSHVIPRIDDGSGSIEESLNMLIASKKQGIDVVYATSHFYASEDNPDSFFDRRDESAAKLMQAMLSSGLELPELRFGVEVAYYVGIGRSEEIKKFCYQESSELLLEMNYGPWSFIALEDARALIAQGITPVLAHVERFLRWNPVGMIYQFKEEGAKIQCNASFFLNEDTKETALKWYKQGFIDYIGSDMHNTTTRPQNLGAVYDMLGL